MLTTSLNIADFLATSKQQLEKYLTSILPTADMQDHLSLYAAMRYSTLNSGKRLRPALVYATGHALGCEQQSKLTAAAAAIELIHCYSLVHDDLPAMDNDDLRRGLPSCHKAFSEATAILTGDTLQTFAFEILSSPQHNPLPAEVRIKMVNVLAKAAGHNGMVLGQAQDLAAEQKIISLEQLKQIHQHKTGALIIAAVELGMLAANCQNQQLQKALTKFAKCIGLAFQVYDDILDISASTAELGKPAGSDLTKQKATFPALMGIKAATAYAEQLYADGLAAIADCGEGFYYLRELAKFFINRKF